MATYNHIVCSMLWLCLSCSVGYAQKKDYQVVVVAFYNFENLFDTVDHPYKFDEDFTPQGLYAYTAQVYEEKLKNLSQVIFELGTDVTPFGAALIGTAEIENGDVLRDLAHQALIKNRNYQYVWFEGPDSRGIDVALMYHPHYFQVLYAKSLTVNLENSKIKSGGRTRDILYVKGVLLGDTTHVFVNHWPSRRGGEAATAPLRKRAAAVCRTLMDSLYAANPQAKIILMGDFNDDPLSASVTKVIGASGEKNNIKPSGLYNPWVAFYKAGKGTLAYQDSWNLFDQIMISRTYLKECEGLGYWKAEIFNRHYLIEQFGAHKGYPRRSFKGNSWANGYSDHLPTIVYLIKEKK